MNHATRATVATFGVLAGLAGVEHGVGEILQGKVAPNGPVILSWPDAAAFRTLAGEPAMTLLPNLLVNGILAVLVSLLFLVWANFFVQRRRGGPVLILLSVAMLLGGGGFGPPLLGLILGVTATRIYAPLTWWRRCLSHDSRRFLASSWPWLFGATLAAWLLLMPGSMLLDYFALVSIPELVVPIAAFSAYGLLLGAIFAGFAYDACRRTDVQATAALSG